MNTPKPKLKDDVLYFGDNGRITCGSLRCAGMTAHFTGRATSGQRVKRVSDADNQMFVAEFGAPACCEICKRQYEARS